MISAGNVLAETVKDKGFYINDLLQGRVLLFYPDGKVKVELNFRNNRQEGVSRTYDENGKVQFVYTHRKGQLINRKTFNQDGKLEGDQGFSQPQAKP